MPDLSANRSARFGQTPGRPLTAGDPAFRGDDGSADPDVASALAAFASGAGGEHAATVALAGSRLLVPVVAVESAAVSDGSAAEMALPTLIGRDGRPAVPAFTCLDALHGWQAGARPVPVLTRQVCQAAVAQACAVVIDVAGPVPFVLDGARLEALACGAAAPEPFQDPDVQETVAAALAGYRGVTSFTLAPGGDDHDLTVTLSLAPELALELAPELTGPEAQDVAAAAGAAIMARLGGRLRRGVAIRFGTCCAG